MSFAKIKVSPRGLECRTTMRGNRLIDGQMSGINIELRIISEEMFFDRREYFTVHSVKFSPTWNRFQYIVNRTEIK